MRSWKAEGLVDTQGLVSTKPIKLGNCTILLDEDRMCINIVVQVSDKIELDDVKRLLLSEAKNTCLALSMVTGTYFGFNDFSRVIETTPAAKKLSFMESIEVRGRLAIPELKASLHKEVVEILELLKKQDKYGLKAADYFEKGMTLNKWNEDAFLNFFKVIELFSEKYSKEADQKEIRRVFGKPKGDLTTREKTLFTCLKLKIPSRWKSKVDDLVDKRNKQDVAHATLSTGDVNFTNVDDCRELAKLMIVRHLMRAHTSTIQ